MNPRFVRVAQSPHFNLLDSLLINHVINTIFNSIPPPIASIKGELSPS